MASHIFIKKFEIYRNCNEKENNRDTGFYVHDTCESGVKFMEMYGSIIPGCADRYIFAKKIVEKFQGDDLIQFIAEMLLCYDGMRFKYISADKNGVIHTGL